MRLLRIAIWLATGIFVVMLFTPLVREMQIRISGPADSAGP
jgi:hypothetical protein